MDETFVPETYVPGAPEGTSGMPLVINYPARADSIFTRPVLVGAGVGFLARGVTGAIVGAILGSFWKR